VVLSDVMMPEMDGHQLVQWVAANHPTTRTALMSGYDEVRDKCSCPPPCQLITKPFSPRKIVSFVEEVLATLDGEDLLQHPASACVKRDNQPAVRRIYACRSALSTH
jgi:YesN/AraC family two-component response regulator